MREAGPDVIDASGTFAGRTFSVTDVRERYTGSVTVDGSATATITGGRDVTLAFERVRIANLVDVTIARSPRGCCP